MTIPVNDITIGVSYRHRDGGRYTVTAFPVVRVEDEDCPGVAFQSDTSDEGGAMSKVQFSQDFTWEPV
jgi:hypothetical protein